MITKEIITFLGQHPIIEKNLGKICEKKSRFQTGCATIYNRKGSRPMKLTTARLKKIISEELDRLNEVKNEEVQLATMQAMAQGDAVNSSSDPEIVQQIQHAVKALSHLVSGLSDGSMKGACMGPLNSFQQVLDQVHSDVDDRPSTTPTQWGENETPS